MRSIKRVCAVIILLVVSLVCLTVVLENQQGVSLSFFGYSTPSMPVSVFLGLALITGMVIGPFLSPRAPRGGARREARST